MATLVVTVDERTREALVRLGEREGLSVAGYAAQVLALTAAANAEARVPAGPGVPDAPSAAIDHALLHKHMVSIPEIAGITSRQIDDILVDEYGGRFPNRSSPEPK